MKLPMIGEVLLENFTLRQADSLLEAKFVKFYEQPYVRTRYTNKRVIVFKGKEAFVFPLRNEKVHLIEVLAATGGMGIDLRASNIRLIRGDLQDPTVYLINLRKMSGVMKQNLVVEPNDIIYVEPNYLQSFNNLTPILTVLTTILTFTLLLRR